MLHPLISIIIPIYKVEPYLRRCIDSIVNQTYVNLEIILVDDGSPDKCPQICDKYAMEDVRIKVIHKKNGGLSDARNVGTKEANGTYLYYVDSDDELPLNTVEEMVSLTQQFPKAEVIVGKAFCPQNDSLYKDQLFDDIRIFDNNADFRKYHCGSINEFPVNAWNKLILKSFLLKNKLFFKKGIIHEDQLWMFHVSTVLKYVVCVNKITYIHHLNSNSIMTGTSNKEKLHSWGIILQEIFSAMTPPIFAKQFYKYYLLLNHFYPQINKDDKHLYDDAWKQCSACASRNGFMGLAFFVFLHKTLYKILKGHGTGFAVWFLLTKCHIPSEQ